MKRLICLFCLLVFVSCVVAPAPGLADSGHARIVRLSLVQGDVRYSRQFHKDALDDTKAIWEPAPLNLPIREGFAVATDGNARAEVEFENGAMAFLSGNTVIEFYDLSLDDGALITRLILRQGSAIFYVHPARGDYFSVTGGDFSVQADGRSRFRLDNYDDGSMVSVEQGQVEVLHKKETKLLAKGESYSIDVNEGQNPILGRAPDYDAFDKWVSGRVDSVVTATTYANDYVSSPAYTAGFADLYSYGNWYNMPGYGYCWQPFGVGLGWSPFAFGSWNYDPFLGWNFIGSAPWGWLPYHYGGWVFNPALGWVWAPVGFRFGGPLYYRPVTAVWVHSTNGVNGLVPLHPGDLHGKPPLNLNQGVYAVHGNTIAANTIGVAAGDKWNVLNHPSHEILTSTAANPAPAPTKVSRTILSGNSGSRTVTLSRDSSIAYDPATHRFVNNGDPTRAQVEAAKPANGAVHLGKESTTTAAVAGSNVRPNVAPVPHSNVSRPNVAPPHPPSSSYGGSSSHGSATWGGTSSGSTSSASSSGHSSGSSAGGHSGGGGGHH
jgi:uncharacterized membrane protein YgcG